MPTRHVCDHVGCRKNRDPWRRFTLVEMLVVIAIIGILAALLMPSLHSALDSARAIDCRNRLHQFTVALNSYASDNSGIIAMATPLPPSGTYWAGWDYPLFGGIPSTPRYIDDPGMNTCPAVKARFDSATDSKFAHYGGNIESGAQNNTSGALPAISPYSFKRIFCRANQLTNNHALIADTWQQNTTGGAQFYYFTHGAPWERNALHLRHADRANIAFIDGHVDAAGIERIMRCKIKYAYDRYKVLLGPLF